MDGTNNILEFPPQVQDDGTCKICRSLRLFMCTHNGIPCGHCVECCPDRRRVVESLPKKDRKKARKALFLIPESEG